MPNTKHTPGPWRACRDGECDCGYVYGPPVPEIGGETPVVAIVCGPMHTDYGDIVPKREQQAANIRLIAAAPDLLAACEALLRCEDERIRRTQTADQSWTPDQGGGAEPDYTLYAEAVRLARSALAKARGEGGSDHGASA